MSFVEIIDLLVVLIYTLFKKESKQVTNNHEDSESDIRTTAETDIQTNTKYETDVKT